MTQNNSSNNKRIAKNTAYLYLRMLLVAFVSLYTSRLVLKNLGAEDFGIYNVVGGVVTFMGFLTAAMSSATQRFLTYNLGLNDSVRYRQTFSLLINIYLLFCAFSFIVLELVGPFYISHYMKLPSERLAIAQWVFQFSLLSFLLNAITVPFRSSIIAYEKMGIYALVGILETFLALGVVVGLPYIHLDKLFFYALLMCIAHLIITVIIILYCRINLADCRYQRYWNNAYFKELLSYSGWNLFGSVSSVFVHQGQAIVINYFFGPVTNAAKAIADRVNSMVTQFSNNFYMATAPQIIKSYAAANIEYMRSLVLNSSRYSFLMLLVIAAPLYVVMESFLSLWLGGEQVTSDMVLFCKWVVISTLINVLEQPITQAVRATGDIKKYQIYVGSVTLSFLPLCIILFLLGAPAYSSMILLSVVYLVALFVRILIVAPIIHIRPLDYYKSVIIPLVIVSIVIIIVLSLCYRIDYFVSVHWIVKLVFTCFLAIIVSYLVGLSKKERVLLLSFIGNKVFKK